MTSPRCIHSVAECDNSGKSICVWDYFQRDPVGSLCILKLTNAKLSLLTFLSPLLLFSIQYALCYHLLSSQDLFPFNHISHTSFVMSVLGIGHSQINQFPTHCDCTFQGKRTENHNRFKGNLYIFLSFSLIYVLISTEMGTETEAKKGTLKAKSVALH